MREIVIKESARMLFKQNEVTELTIDIESYSSSCLTVSEALVTEGAPESLDDYDRYEVEGISIYVYEPLEFINNRIILSKAKGWFAKNKYAAEHLKQI